MNGSNTCTVTHKQTHERACSKWQFSHRLHPETGLSATTTHPIDTALLVLPCQSGQKQHARTPTHTRTHTHAQYELHTLKNAQTQMKPINPFLVFHSSQVLSQQNSYGKCRTENKQTTHKSFTHDTTHTNTKWDTRNIPIDKSQWESLISSQTNKHTDRSWQEGVRAYMSVCPLVPFVPCLVRSSLRTAHEYAHTILPLFFLMS